MTIMVPTTTDYSLEPARTPQAYADARALFLAYARSLPIDLGYQRFDAELDTLPGQYAPPHGELLIARDSTGTALGCVALRPFAPGVAEMKRLYVAPEARGAKLGDRLARAICEVAAARGYAEIRLDTLASMQSAIALYEKLGFVRIDAYYDTPIADTVFFSKRLDAR